jgi:4-aminobutyrate aminotransferase-like enzyme/Ser/Thr protein kinase RdoA (MazF antagonist)
MFLIQHAPRFSVEFAQNFVKENYNIDGQASSLPSERDQNFLIEASNGENYVLKIANSLEDPGMLEAQQLAMTHVASQVPICQRVIADRNGKTVSVIEVESGAKHFAWLVTYLKGIPLGQIRRRSLVLLTDLGSSIARLDRALASFDHPAVHRDFHWDLANAMKIIQQYQSKITDQNLRELILSIAEDFESRVIPKLSQLPTQTIHNDANDFNIIVGGGNNLYTRNQNVIGLIDFGDIVHSYRVSDLAVAIAYGLFNQDDPLAAAANIVRGYHSENLLTENELDVLWDLVKIRFCMSVCLAAHQQSQRPDDEYLSISQQPIQNTLPELHKIHHRFATAMFRHTCNITTVATAEKVITWLKNNDSAPVLGVNLRTNNCIVFDLSVSGPLISGDPSENSEPKLTERLFGAMDSAAVNIGIGRYDEPRLFYLSSIFTSIGEPRVIHLGIDLFAKAGTPVYAPMDGIVEAFANNAAPQDYGPMIILKHLTNEGIVFYTVYGHLSLDSLKELSIGKKITKGEKIASIGTPDINGGGTPHLHLQIVTDLLDLSTDFPGVARASQREVWHSFSPDPNLILGIPQNKFPAKTENRKETLITRKDHIGQSVRLSYKEPLKIVRGWMQYLFTDEAKKYLDAYNNVPHVGHCHPRVVKASYDQISVLNTNTRYLSDVVNHYAERLCTTLPDPLRVCFFVNSGSEANELAVRLARTYTGNRDFVVLESAYHGHTTTLIDLSPYKHRGPGGKGPPDWVHAASLPDIYRGAYKKDDPHAGKHYADSVRGITENLKKKKKGLAGFIAESCPSVGGQLMFPDDYLKEVYAAVREAGGVCIADEIQTAYGRIGTHFWGFESQNVVPDIVTTGKPIGNGHPIGVVITTPEIAEAFNNGMEFFSTFGGNTVSCAIGLAVLDVVQQEQLQQHALEVGNFLLNQLRELQKEFTLIGDVRGSGLFLGVELVGDRNTLEPATDEASFVCNRMRDLGVLIGTDGPYDNVLKIRPPLPFSKDDAAFLTTTMRRIFAEDF